jgi:hypothetical protein
MPSPFACKSMMEYRDHTHAVFNLHTHHDMNSVTEKNSVTETTILYLPLPPHHPSRRYRPSRNLGLDLTWCIGRRGPICTTRPMYFSC